MIRKKKKGKKSLIIATVFLAAAAFCGIDYSSPGAMDMGHADASSLDCVADSCLALTSKDPSSPIRTAGFILPFFMGLTAGFSGPFLQGPSFRLLFFTKEQPPKGPKKLYQLHAAYLL